MRKDGQMAIEMVPPIEGTPIKLCTQVTKVTRPLLSVIQITEEGKLKVVCGQVKAVVVDFGGKADGATNNQGAIMKAMAACGSAFASIPGCSSSELLRNARHTRIAASRSGAGSAGQPAARVLIHKMDPRAVILVQGFFVVEFMGRRRVYLT